MFVRLGLLVLTWDIVLNNGWLHVTSLTTIIHVIFLYSSNLLFNMFISWEIMRIENMITQVKFS